MPYKHAESGEMTDALAVKLLHRLCADIAYPHGTYAIGDATEGELQRYYAYCLAIQALEERQNRDIPARWVPSDFNGYMMCSCCQDCYIDEAWADNGKWNYCPSCGARMEAPNGNT